jgi:hypothetical protein
MAAYMRVYRRQNPKAVARAKKKNRRKPEVRRRHAELARLNYKKNRERRLARLHKITVDQLLMLRKRAKGRCEICGRRSRKRLHVDHCHKTKKVRGLLCNNCNIGIGMLNDCPKRIRSALRYLARPLSL